MAANKCYTHYMNYDNYQIYLERPSNPLFMKAIAINMETRKKEYEVHGVDGFDVLTAMRSMIDKNQKEVLAT